MAGSWGGVEGRGLRAVGGSFQSMFAVAREFTADAADASVPDWEILDQNPAFLADIGVVFDADVAPSNTLTIIIEDIDGLRVAEEVFTASGRKVLTNRPSVIGGCTVSVGENAVNSAKAKVILNFANNLR